MNNPTNFIAAGPLGGMVKAPDPAEAARCRLPILEPADWDPRVTEAMGVQGMVFNVLKVAAGQPAAFAAWLPFGKELSVHSLLSDRQHEIVIMRLAVRLDADYEWGAHRWISSDVRGVLDDTDFAALQEEQPDHWDHTEAAIIGAVDDLTKRFEISDANWDRLIAAGLDHQQIIDLIYLVGNYMIVAMFAKTSRVPLEPGLSRLPERATALAWVRD